MILTTDSRHRYMKQLTHFQPNEHQLGFALDLFIDDRENHCCIKKRPDGYVAVYTRGKYDRITPEEAYEYEKLGVVTVDIFNQ